MRTCVCPVATTIVIMDRPVCFTFINHHMYGMKFSSSHGKSLPCLLITLTQTGDMSLVLLHAWSFVCLSGSGPVEVRLFMRFEVLGF